jgi:hypothetical protein
MGCHVKAVLRIRPATNGRGRDLLPPMSAGAFMLSDRLPS